MLSRKLAALAVTTGALVLGAGGSAASTAAPRTLWTTGTVAGIAADGARVAVSTTQLPKLCDRVVVSNPVARTSIHWSAQTNCPGDGTSGGQALLGAALAGTRIAWLEAAGGNDQELMIRTASLTGVKKAKLVAFQTNGNGAGGDPEGGYLGNLHGDGSLLAYNSWQFCNDHTGVELPPRPPCTLLTKGIIAQKLWKTTSSGGESLVKTGPLSYPLVAADGGRLAVQDDAAAKVTILDAAGHVLKTIAIKPGSHRGTALNGAQLAVLTGATIDVYSTQTGAPTTSLPASGAAPALTDLQSGLALYTTGRQVHAVRLSDGRNRVVATSPTALRGAQLESTGLWYAYNLASGTTRGRVVFLPWAAVQTALG